MPALDTRDGRVIWMVTVSLSAELRQGLNIGDSRAIARRWFPRLVCTAHDSAGPDGDETGRRSARAAFAPG